MKNALVVSTIVLASLLIDVSDVVSGFSFDAFRNNVHTSFTRQSSDSNPRAMGGTKVKAGDIPFIVSIHYKMDDKDSPMQHNCGGAILDTDHIVTAGHCVWNKSVSDMAIVAGAGSIKKKEDTQQKRKLEKIFLHPKYTAGDRPGPYDIAIIQVQKPFTFNKYVDKIEVAQCKESAYGRKCFYAGWGNMLPVSQLFYQGSEELMKGNTTIIKMKECREAYMGFKEELATAVCSKSGVLHGTCQGDSGGPLFCYRKKKSDSYLAGVVSFGFPVCNDGYHPDVYTDLGNKKICKYIMNYEKLSENSTISSDDEKVSDDNDSNDDESSPETTDSDTRK